MRNTVHLLVCGGNMALLLNGQSVATLDPDLHDNAAAEVFDRVCDSLPTILATTLDRIDIDEPQGDWTWDELIAQAGIEKIVASEEQTMSTRPSESYQVTWGIDVDINEASNPIEAAKVALDAIKHGEETHYFVVVTPNGNTVNVDLDAPYVETLSNALESLDAHNDDDQDEPLYLYEVEAYLVSTEDPGTAIDQETVYCAAFNPEHAKEEAEIIAKRERFIDRQEDEYVMIESVSQIDPEDYR